MAPERVRDLPEDRPSAGDAAGGRAQGHEMLHEVARKGARRVRARREGRHGLGYGLGLFGLIGWSVSVPTLLGIALGVWVDRTTASPYSWTLMLMLVGVVLGCLNAWYWLRREGGLDDAAAGDAAAGDARGRTGSGPGDEPPGGAS